ncbi:hypothetical protein [Pseudomonas asplenii]|uniref:hypothetical protein n=1 Tax=Pseudomonas asplenii TaxID=53407 RepID=UPI0006CC204A|nr:hypothetical protein [Pseudomonas fuscovaginae]KPA93731.1 hypothetical protein PF70_06325 [Pseudomonas fuscovaginae]
MLNQEVNNEIIRGDFQGKTSAELKGLYVKRNSLNVSPGEHIYRLFRIDYLLKDVKESTLSLVKVCPDSFDDPGENPLIDKKFMENGDEILLGFLDCYYTLCWTDDPLDSRWRRDRFLRGRAGARVRVSLEKFMYQMMDERDRYFMLHCFAARVEYRSDEAMQALLSSNDYSVHLDSLGQGGALAVSTVTDFLEEEREIRIVYSYERDNAFVAEQVRLEGNLCRIPFDWTNIIEEINFDESVSKQEYEKLLAQLRSHGINCPITLQPIE